MLECGSQIHGENPKSKKRDSRLLVQEEEGVFFISMPSGEHLSESPTLACLITRLKSDAVTDLTGDSKVSLEIQKVGNEEALTNSLLRFNIRDM
ncbi:hypothetical protein J6590_077995 [Homalodisca vitripennis]|nr:hypothetical protein J6590_077995 [Homalodisca vitripennis]